MEDFASQEAAKEEGKEVAELVVEDSHCKQRVHDSDPQPVLHVLELDVTQRIEEGPSQEGAKHQEQGQGKVA